MQFQKEFCFENFHFFAGEKKYIQGVVSPQIFIMSPSPISTLIHIKKFKKSVDPEKICMTPKFMVRYRRTDNLRKILKINYLSFLTSLTFFADIYFRIYIYI